MSGLVVAKDRDNEYYIKYLPINKFWLQKETGEGMEISAETLYKALDQIYEEEF